MAKGYSAKLPVSRDLDDGFTLTKTLEEVATQNLKNLLMTNPGERGMDPRFGGGIKRFLFEAYDADTRIRMNEKIKEQVARYLSYIDIRDLDFRAPGATLDSNLLSLKITYSILPSTKLIIADFLISLS